jgi:nucleoside phosphorylase/DNA polymerase III delta prime subunit
MALAHDAYTVAWVCALPLEMAAAKAMLDTVHPSLPQAKADHNVYALGAIEGHNVVLACLPSGIYGKVSASTVVSHLVFTYTNVQFALIVGIGGGVPLHADIRLGDVVVSRPTATSTGVIQYDYGKTLREGKLQRTGSLDKPPLVLLKAVAHLESNSMIGKGASISGSIERVLQKNEEMREAFSRPECDWLFQSTYEHDEGNSNCLGCNQSQLVVRPERMTNEPCIHYGLIASGDQVMKHARTRDCTASDLGILCFEMEAAGIMDQVRSIVVRGICDYCDSHKQKNWQGYAAMTAAAYAKSLLSTVPVSIEKSMQTFLNYGRLPTDLILAYKWKPEEAQECLKNLFLTDPVEDKNALKRRKGDRAAGTCEWILKADEIMHWLDNSRKESDIFWLHGNPGTGKSTMVLTITSELPKQASFSNSNRKLAYFFCDSSSEKRRTAVAILRGLLYHLVKQCPTLIRYLVDKYQERGEQLFSSFDALWDVLMKMGQNKNDTGYEIYCIIDALDECEYKSQQMLLRQINQTFKADGEDNVLSRPRFLITSRPYPEIRESLSHLNNKDLASYNAVKRDIKVMIREKVKDLADRKAYPERVTAEISRTLEEKAEGTFLWIGIACGELIRVQSRNAVQKLEKLPIGLHALYQQLLGTALANSDDNDDDNDNDTLVDMLRVVAFARRPLAVSELSTLCRLYPDYDEESRLQFTKELIDSCRLMIVIQDDRVQLLHKSVKDFLIRERHEIDNLKAHADMANQCIDYILNGDGPPESKNSFLEYADEYWPEHAGLAEAEFVICPHHEPFFEWDSNKWNQWLRRYSSRYEEGFCALHAAARWAILPLVLWALRGYEGKYDDAKFQSSTELTPLLEAVQHGHIDVIAILLANMTVGSIISVQVLIAAAANSMNGYGVMGYLLKQHKDRVQITDRVVQIIANDWRYAKAMKGLLINHQRDHKSITPFSVALICERFKADVVELLLGKEHIHIKITEEIVGAVARNQRDRKQVMKALLYDRHVEPPTSKDVLAMICNKFDADVVTLLLERLGPSVQVTVDMLKAAVENWKYGKDVAKVLLERHDTQIQIPEDVLKSAAANRRHGRQLMELLFQHQGKDHQIVITEDVVKTAAINEGGGKEIVEFLLTQPGQVPITENVLKSVVSNWGNGKQMLELLLGLRGSHVVITLDVMKAIKGNPIHGKEMVKLLRQRGIQIPVVIPVVEEHYSQREKELYGITVTHGSKRIKLSYRERPQIGSKQLGEREANAQAFAFARQRRRYYTAYHKSDERQSNTWERNGETSSARDPDPSC